MGNDRCEGGVGYGDDQRLCKKALSEPAELPAQAPKPTAAPTPAATLAPITTTTLADTLAPMPEVDEPLAAYALGATGSALCPAGYEAILEDAACQRAATRMEKSWSAATHADWCPAQRPQGCFVHTGNGVVYNNDRCEGGVGYGNDQRLCKLRVGSK